MYDILDFNYNNYYLFSYLNSFAHKIFKIGLHNVNKVLFEVVNKIAAKSCWILFSGLGRNDKMHGLLSRSII